MVSFFIASGRSTSFFLEDLTSGEIFGESVLAGNTRRYVSVISTNHCDLAVVDSQDYLHVLEGGTRKLSADEKCAFLNNIPIFQNCDFYRKFEIANSLTQIEVERGHEILDAKKVSHSLFIILEGRVDFVSEGGGKVSSIEKFSYFGESGILYSKFKLKVFLESFRSIASSRAELLVLPKSHYHTVESNTLDVLKNLYFSKRLFRSQRKRDFEQNWRRLNAAQIDVDSALTHPAKEEPMSQLRPFTAPAAFRPSGQTMPAMPMTEAGRLSSSALVTRPLTAATYQSLSPLNTGRSLEANATKYDSSQLDQLPCTPMNKCFYGII